MEKKERARVYSKNYYLKNKDRISLARKEKYNNSEEHRRAVLSATERSKFRHPVTHIFSLYRCSARRRKIDFSLTKESIKNFWQKSCRYCGKSIERLGIDRVDNNRGYVEGNMVPCCSTCNTMKSDMTLEEFYAHVRRIIDHLTNKEPRCMIEVASR